MSGITTGIGLASGIDSGTLIERLLSIEARPRVLAQQRLLQLQTQQAAYFDLNSRLGTLRAAAAKFRTGRIFDSMRAASSEPKTLTATATLGAQAGSYKLLVDRLVTSQQMLSRGFADRDSTGLGATSFTFEGAEGRLDRDTDLSDLNGGEGVRRGKIVLSVNGVGTTVDLSKAATVGEVLEAINGAGSGVTARVEGGRFVLTTASPSDTLTVSNATGYTTAESLRILGTASAGTLSGGDVYRITGTTSLRLLNDGNGVDVGDDRGTNPQDFTIRVGSGPSATTVSVYLGARYGPDPDDPDKIIQLEAAAGTMGKVVERINQAISNAFETPIDLSVRINSDGTALELVNNSGEEVVVADRMTGGVVTRSTASDLGLAGTYQDGTTTKGRRLLASMNSTLASNLNGGAGIAVNGSGLGELVITDRLGGLSTITFAADASIEQIIRAINDHPSTTIAASLNQVGNGIVISDTSGGTSNLVIQGASAASLGLDTGGGGVAASSKDSDSLQRAYIARSTLVSDLNGGLGIGTGRFRITASNGVSVVADIGSDTRTVADLLQELNGLLSTDTNLEAAINDRGDGILIRERDGSPAGTQAIRIEDISGGVAKALRLAGQAKGVGAENFIDGSYETTVTFDPSDTLSKIVGKINAAGVGVSASILNSGSSSNPFRISLSSASSGRAGRFLLDTNGFNLGLETLEAGNDARVFLGSDDPAKAILLQSSVNTLDQAISGVSIDLLTTSASPVELTVSRDTGAFESAVNEFITAFNAVISRIDEQSKYDPATKRKGVLLGDGTAQGVRANLFSSIQNDGTGLTGTFRFLTQVGIGFEGGRLTFNRERFRQALEEDFEAVKDIFAAREQESGDGFQTIAPGVQVRVPLSELGFSKLGVVGALEETLKSYVDSIDGSITKRAEAIGSQITLQQSRIAFLTEKLTTRRGLLERQFVAMEQAIASLSNQQSVLGQIQGIGAVRR